MGLNHCYSLGETEHMHCDFYNTQEAAVTKLSFTTYQEKSLGKTLPPVPLHPIYHSFAPQLQPHPPGMDNFYNSKELDSLTSVGVSEYSLILSTATMLVSISLVIRTTQVRDWVTWKYVVRSDDLCACVYAC